LKIKSVAAADELAILKACVTDTVTVSRLASLSDQLRFRTKYGRLVFDWCVGHLEKYGEAPGIQTLTEYVGKWSLKNTDDAVLDRLENFIVQLDDLPVNTEYIADKIGAYFSRLSLEKLNEDLTDMLEVSDVEQAQAAVASWRPVQIGMDRSIDVLRDKDAMARALDFKKEALVQYPAGLGEFFGNDLGRGALIAFMGPEKRGKTFWLMDVAWRAMTQRLRVAFFSIGDMTEEQCMSRFMERAARRPMWPTTAKIPKELAWGADRKSYTVRHEERTWDDKLTFQDAWKACDQIVNYSGSNKPLLRLSVHANDTVGVEDIETQLDFWEKDGWMADVIVVDYADLLLFPRGSADTRDGTNRVWKRLRKLTQERHCLGVTATQTSAASYDAYVITRSHFSEDKRKLAHVTGMVGLNQTDAEKNDGIMRLNWIVRRDNAFSEFKCCLCAGSPAVGNLAIRSVYNTPKS
jgi:hypothetical protein